MNLAKRKNESQLSFEELDLRFTLLNKRTPEEAFLFVFSKEYLTYAYETSVGLKRVRGVDGVTLRIFEDNKEKEFDLISKKVKEGTYKFTPYLEVLKSKGRGKPPRILSTPTIRDKLTLFCLKDFLQYLYNNEIPRHHPNEHISRLCNTLKKNKDVKYYYRGDLKDFYPSIPREKLIRSLKERSDYKPFVKLIEGALKTPTKPITAKGPPQSGVPQGLSISNILADIYLLDLDKKLRKSGAFCGRFVDDIVFAGDYVSSRKAYVFLRIWLWKRGLKLSKEKSGFGLFKDGIDYLGYHIRYNEKSEKVYVGVRKSSQNKLSDSLCGLITSYKYSEELKHLHRLNRRISGVIWKNKKYGWLFYFSELNDLSILRRFDSLVSQLKERAQIKGYSFKKFTNSYWRIKNAKWGNYITNFDEYSIDQMKEYLIGVTDKERDDLEKLSYAVIERLFSLEVQKEIDRMEQDVGDMY